MTPPNASHDIFSKNDANQNYTGQNPDGTSPGGDSIRLMPSKPQKTAIMPDFITQSPIVFRVIVTLLWAVCHFVFCFILQISELVAPLLLILGIGWMAVPHLVGLVSNTIKTSNADTQTQDIVTHLSTSFPSHLVINGHEITPHSLIMNGLGLMALAAFSATLCAWLGRRL